MPIEFNEILDRGSFTLERTRLVRHHDNRKECIKSPYALWREDPCKFEFYQRIQSKKKFGNALYLASFVRTPSDETLFVGMFKIKGLEIAPAKTIDPATGYDCNGYHFYTIERDGSLDEFIGRLTIEWGDGYRSWVQNAHSQYKNVREIRISFEDQPFPGYFLFRCRLSEINQLPNGWIERLRTAKGIYVLTSTATGAHYVGSAAGQGGFFQRWQQHAAVGGAAVGLQAHGATDYQVAILQVAAGFESDSDIVRTENHWMDKLQTRGMGLNGQPQLNASTAPQSLP